jgi:TPR repeat protein
LFVFVRFRSKVALGKTLHMFADSGDSEAQFELAGLFSTGQGVQQSDEQCALWMETAASRGHTTAMFKVLVVVVTGFGWFWCWLGYVQSLNVCSQGGLDYCRWSLDWSRAQKLAALSFQVCACLVDFR